MINNRYLCSSVIKKQTMTIVSNVNKTANKLIYQKPDKGFYQTNPMDEFKEKALAAVEKTDKLYVKNKNNVTAINS